MSCKNCTQRFPFLKTFFLAVVLAFSFFAKGQVTIASQDFESTPATPTLSFTTSDVGTVGANTGFSTGQSGASGSNAPASVNLFSGGARGYRIHASSNSTAARAFTFSSINTNGYSNISLSLRMAGMSLGSNGNGIDASTDEVLIEVSPDGGTNWYQQAKVISANSNVRWSFGATGTGTRAYEANNLFSSFTTTGTGTITSGTTAITTATITGLPSVSNLQIRVTAQCNSSNESWIIDDLVLSGEAAGSPSIAISNQHPTAANIAQGSINNILGIYQLDVTTANATLTGISTTTAGTYTSSDIATNGFKFWINNATNLTGATQIGASQAAVNSGGTVAVGSLNQSITTGTTRYILLTADLASNATISNTISLTSTSFANITFSSGNKTGTDPISASNSMTFIACTPVNVTAAGATNGNAQSVLSWTNPSCFDELLIVARASMANDGTPIGDGTAYTANSIFGSGTALGNGFVVYKGSSSGQTVTNLTNGTTYFFKIFTRKGTTWSSGIETTASPVLQTTATDFFRSNVSTGNWNTASSWESSADETTWITSTLVPDNNANTITIRNGHSITINSTGVTLDQVVIANGGTLNFNATSLVVNNGTNDDIIVQNGGIISYQNAGFTYNSGATININTGGILSIDVSGITGSAAAIHQTSHVYGNASILRYNLTSQPSASGITYFPNVNASTVPIFRLNQNLIGTVGGSSATVINGRVEFGSSVTSMGWSGNGLKTIRNGIVTLGTTTVTSTDGNLQIGDGVAGTAAEIGGVSGSLTISTGNLVISENCTATLTSSTTINSNLSLNSGSLSLGANTLTLGGAVSGSGTFIGGDKSNLTINGTAGTINFAQTIDASRSILDGSNALANLTLGSSGSATIGSKLNLFGTLTVNGSGSLNTGEGLLVFRNTATSTARLATISGTPSFTGTVIVENYINNQSRGWRLLGSPLTSAGTGGTVTPSIQSNWQSNFGYAGNYGTNFYSPSGSLGMDGTTNRHSLLRFIADTLTVGGWTNVNTTGVDLFNADAQNASTSTNPVFFTFIRGDKSVTAVPNAGTPQTFVPTTIASRGRVTFGNKTVNLTGRNNGYAAVVNPFISPVDANSLTFTNIQSTGAIYVWDPTLGSTGLGGYATLSDADNYAASGNMTKFLQTGQAFLVQLNGTSGSVVFEEGDKVSDFTATVTGAGNGLKDVFSTKLHFVNADGSKLLADAHKVIFGSNYAKSFNLQEDAPKFQNGGENLSSKIGNNLLSVDLRPYIQNADTIFMNFTNNRVANYEFEFNPSNFDATVTSAKLVDKFLNTETPISLSANTTVPFSITSTTGSNAADRFMIVFEGTGALPNKNFTVTGEKLGNNKVKINWEAQAETGVREYTLERSVDGTNYTNINTQTAKNGNATQVYNYTDNEAKAGVNYYRVKTTQLNDIERYSQVITINNRQSTNSNVSVFPNPVKGNTIGLQLQDLEKGMYSVRILSIEGKEVYKQQLQVSGSNLNTTINPTTKLASGTYTLQVVGKNNSYTSKLLVD